MDIVEQVLELIEEASQRCARERLEEQKRAEQLATASEQQTTTESSADI